ncbi:type I toxin-antitoxin system Fst family toxin [Listeria sp. PSOL-1]|nr:type I toxin-antitoxin system Fst family toxin [Listeria sp. PSOL-1]
MYEFFTLVIAPILVGIILRLFSFWLEKREGN